MGHRIYAIEISTLRHQEDILYLQDPAEVKKNAICAQCRYGTCYANKVGTQVLSTPVAITPYTTTTAIYIHTSHPSVSTCTPFTFHLNVHGSYDMKRSAWLS